MRNLLRKVQEILSTPQRLKGLSIIRVVFGIYMVGMYCLNLGNARLLWGNTGAIPENETFRPPHFPILSLYTLTSSHSAHIVLYALGIILAILFASGYYTRITSILFFVTTASLYNRNEMLMDGGDNLLVIISLWMMLTNCSGRPSWWSDTRWRSTLTGTLLALMHNVGVIAIVAQVILLYTTSAFSKMGGNMWRDGTAIYYIMKSKDFDMTPYSAMMWRSDIVVTLATYSTMFVQAIWPILIWFKPWKYMIAAAVIGMHIVIGYCMGLTWFAFLMIGVEAIMFSDAEYITLRHRLITFWDSVKKLSFNRYPLSLEAKSISESIEV